MTVIVRSSMRLDQSLYVLVAADPVATEFSAPEILFVCKYLYSMKMKLLESLEL